MTKVLCVGKYNEKGRFNIIQWKYFIEWCKKECNKVIVYSQMTYDMICTKFPLYCNINELERPDRDLNVHAYEINEINSIFWNYIKDFDYNINKENDISHMFFFQSDEYIASLEIVDYENYILIEETNNKKHNIFLNNELILENNRLCLKGKSDIDDLLQGESWKPLESV